MPPISNAKAAQYRSAVRTAIEAQLGAVNDIGRHFADGFAGMNEEDWRKLADAVLRSVDLHVPEDPAGGANG